MISPFAKYATGGPKRNPSTTGSIRSLPPLLLTSKAPSGPHERSCQTSPNQATVRCATDRAVTFLPTRTRNLDVSKPMTYLGSGSHMSAVLKRDIAENKAKNPHLFASAKRKTSSMASDGKVTITEITDVKATAMSPSRRHAFCTERR